MISIQIDGANVDHVCGHNKYEEGRNPINE